MNDVNARQKGFRRGDRRLLTTLMTGTALWLGALPMVLPPMQAAAQTARAHRFDIPAQPLNRSLRALAEQTGVQIAYETAVASGATAPAVQGTMSTEQALARLLSVSGLRYSFTNANTVTILHSAVAVEEGGSDPGATVLDTITVTAGGFSQSVIEAPASITVIPAEELERRPYRSLMDAVRHVEGVTMIGGDKGDISIRGMPAAGTLIMVDGRRQNSTRELNPKGGNAVEDNWIPPIGAVERIEVVRGPMSSRYGSDAMGGVINIITKKVADRWSGSVGADMTIQGHSRSGNAGQGDFYLTGPIVQDTLGLQLWGYKTGRGEDSIRGGFNKTDNLNGTARLWYTPTPDHDIMLEAHRSRQQYWETPGASATGTSDVYRDYLRESYTFAHTGRWGPGTSQFSYIYDHGSRDAFTAGAADSWMPDVTNHTIDGSYVTPLGDSHMLSFGGQWRRQTLDIGGMRNGQLPPLPDGTPATGQLVAKVGQWALFVEDEWKLTDSFALTGGARYDDNSIFGGHVSPRLYANWQTTENWAIKGGVATGFVAPTMQQYVPYIGNGQRGGATTWGNPDLQPETSLNKEIGAYYDNLDNFSANITYFHTGYNDKIANTGSRCLSAPAGQPSSGGCWVGPDGRPMSVYFNVPKAVIQGVELAARWTMTEELTLSGSYTYTNSKMHTSGISIYGFPLGQADGLAPVSTPRHVATARLDWQARENLNTYLRASYRSEDNQGVNWGGGSNPMEKSVGHLLTFDAGLSWQINESMALNAAVYNITDQTNYDPGRASGYQYVEDGRRLWVGMRGTF
ncbi:TonB-dependent receptor [Shinella sp. PSBB067]|uniref:TonB-dependent receptor domain-containing protein n=1 Tax=Shinella sp. PSBB067 TaxID=2715959 RepID=UPI00193C2C21|nr:TonB-dependent receptor [Shinella sp. PSBB067]QRI62480.1 TonB-dependent receptor [Shinella sp. PSBB067]